MSVDQFRRLNTPIEPNRISKLTYSREEFPSPLPPRSTNLTQIGLLSRYLLLYSIDTHKVNNVNYDECVFDKVDAETIAVAILWFLNLDLFRRLFTRQGAASTPVVVIVELAGRAIFV